MRRRIRSEDIYEALVDADAFDNLPRLMAEAAGARSALMQWQHRDGALDVVRSSYFTPQLVADYPRFAADDPWRLAGLGPGRANDVLLMQEVVPPSLYEKSAIYNDLARAHGDDTFHCMGVSFNSPWGVGMLGVHRGRRDRAFGREEVQRWRRSVRDFSRVLRVRGELEASRRSAGMAHAVLDTLGIAVVTVRSDRRIEQLNAVAEAVLRRSDGLSVRNGSLAADDPGSAARLADAVARATAVHERAAGFTIALRSGGAGSYTMNVAPLVGTVSADCAVVVFRDPDGGDRGAIEQLRALYGLTLVEAEIASQLGRGATPAQLCEKRGVRANTLKSQLRAIGQKMQCSRQSEIAALVAGLLPQRF